MSHTLVICRSLAGIPRLKLLRLDTPWVVASDDPRVHEVTARLPGVVEACFLEELTAFYAVSDDVKRIVGRIDVWLSATAGSIGLPSETLHWGCTVEGGLTSQRVQDALLLINTYLALFERIRPTKVILISEPEARWEDLVLETTARQSTVPLQRITGPWWVEGKSRLTGYFRPMAMAAHHLLHLWRWGGGWRKHAPTPIQAHEAIVFFLLSTAHKHVENIRLMMKSLQQAGSRAMVFSWSATDRVGCQHSADQLGREGLVAIKLEHWSTRGDVASSFQQAWRARNHANQNMHELDIRYHGIDLRPLLAESFRHFFLCQVPYRIQLQRTLHAALGGATPCAVKPWGAPEGFEYQTISRLWGSRRPPAVFQYWVGIGLPWPYADPRQKLDFFLAKDRREAEQISNEYKLPRTSIEIVGHARFAEHQSYAESTSAAASRVAMAVPLERTLYVGYDPNGALRGYQSAREQSAILQALLDAALQAPSLFILIKPHPSYAINHLMPKLSSFIPAHVGVLRRNSSVLEFLNGIDVLVSKYSILLLEAALMDKASIAAIFDGEDRFRVFGSMVETVTSSSALTALLVGLANNPKRLEKWREHRLAKQAEILASNYPMLSGHNTAARSAEALLFQAKRHRSH